MLLFNMQKRWAEVDSLTEHLDVLGMDVCNVYEGQEVVKDIWGLNDKETTEMFIKHRYIVIVVTDELFMSITALYYVELARKLYKKGKIKVYVINNSVSIESFPPRCQWLMECEIIKSYSNPADKKTYAYAMDIVLGIADDLFSDDDNHMKQGVTC